MTETEAKTQEKAAALAAYNAVVDSAKLIGITLVQSSFFVKPDYFKIVAEENESKKPLLKRLLDDTFANCTYDAESKLLGGQFGWLLQAHQGRKKILYIHASYFVSYEDVPNVERVHSEAFIKRVGRFATYPYFRSHVAQLSGASGLELAALPVLR